MSLEWAERIRELRETLDLSRGELAELLDMHLTVVGEWERSIREPTLCWERIIQFLHDCTSNALSILERKPWLEEEGKWGDKIRMVLQSLDWSQEQLAAFMGVTIHTVSIWMNYQRPMTMCHKILVSLLEVYSSVDRKQWPPGLYLEPEDVISSERIRLLRLSLAMKQSQLGNLLHTTNATISYLETGSGKPSWCTNLLLRLIETYPRATDLLERIPWSDERVSSERAKEIRRLLDLTRFELAHFLGMSEGAVALYEREGVKGTGCVTLVYLLLEKYPDEFIPLVETLSSPGGQACPIW